MSTLSPDQIGDLINALSHKTTSSFVAEAQRLHGDGLPTPLATSIVLDAALMSAASFIKTAIFNGVVGCTMPAEDLLRIRLGELLAMETRVFSKLPDGSFDTVGQRRN